MSQATLPQDLERGFEGKISDMPIGRYGYVVPWVMEVDKDGLLWIDTETSVEKTPLGTSCIKVQKVENGFTIDISLCGNYKWKRYTLMQDRNYQPVVELIR